MYTIGEISKIVNISANALRYYDEIGLVKPSLIQNNNQYRYYSEGQVKDIIFIMELKQYGFTLVEIKELTHNKNNEKFKKMLEEKRIKLDKDIARLKDSSILLEKRICEIIKEDGSKMKGGRILIVDDLQLVRIMVKSIIEEYGYICVGEAANGEEAIVAYEKLKPDLVIMDVTMPIMDGIYAANKITEKYKGARIIMCSAMSYSELILESIKVGARDFVSKPLSSLRLINAVVRGLDDAYSFDADRIEYISNFITKCGKEAVFSKTLKQEEIDMFIHEILEKSAPPEFVSNFFEKISFDYTKEECLASRSSDLEEKTIIGLKDKFIGMSKETAAYLSHGFNQKCSLNLLTVESITIGEFRTLINNSDSTWAIKCKTASSPVYIHVYGNLKNKREVLKKLLDFTESNHKLELSKENVCDISLCSDDLKILTEDYQSVLISFSIEFDKGDKGFVAISIPQCFLE